jgi:SAM-dependent methyltransferase
MNTDAQATLDQNERSRDFWNKVAARDVQSGLAGLLDGDPELARYRDRAERQVCFEQLAERIPASARVLEVGCGSGRWTIDLAQRYRQVVALDISAGMIEQAGERLRAAGLSNVELSVAPMDEVTLQGEFDLIYLGSCLHYMDDAAVLRGLERVAPHLAPNGVLLTRDTVSLIGRAFHRSERYGGDDPAIYRTIAWYQDAMKRHGLRLVNAWPTWVKPLTWRLRWALPPGLRRACLERELALASFEVRHPWLLRRPGPKEHRFFRYERVTSGAGKGG